MTLRAIDISSFQTIEQAADPNAQAVVVKATQGTYYVNPNCNGQMDRALKAGKLRGLYHYAGGGNAVAEADFFLKNIEGYLNKDVLLALDWEQGDNANWGSTTWCRAFVDRVHEKTGVWCLIYTGTEGLPQAANCAKDCGLWFACYPLNYASWDVPSFVYSTAPWPYYTIWQFTSGGGLDRNVVNLTEAGWKALAKGKKTEVPKPNPGSDHHYSTTGKSLRTIANDVKAGLAGNGDERKQLLGIYYTGVQAILNGGDPAATLAAETKAGKYGNGDARKKILGEFYDAVQAILNKAASKSYTVKSGESLSTIAGKLGLDWKTLAKNNGINGPYVIYPGQHLKY